MDRALGVGEDVIEARDAFHGEHDSGLAVLHVADVSAGTDDAAVVVERDAAYSAPAAESRSVARRKSWGDAPLQRWKARVKFAASV
jgi:hypothetical protein